MSRRSSWMKMDLTRPGAQAAVLSWFGGICDGCTVESAEVLCDAVTDAERKVKAVMLDQAGNRQLVTYTPGRGRTGLAKVAFEPLDKAGGYGG